MPRLDVLFRDQSIEVGGVCRVVSSGDRVRLVGEGGEEVAARDTAEVVSVQAVGEPDDRARPQRSD